MKTIAGIIANNGDLDALRRCRFATRPRPPNSKRYAKKRTWSLTSPERVRIAGPACAPDFLYSEKAGERAGPESLSFIHSEDLS